MRPNIVRKKKKL